MIEAKLIAATVSRASLVGSIVCAALLVAGEQDLTSGQNYTLLALVFLMVGFGMRMFWTLTDTQKRLNENLTALTANLHSNTKSLEANTKVIDVLATSIAQKNDG